MTTPVKLYVYDLSNGLARQLSRQFIGRQIDGIWHTSVVVFGKEIFYGRGICITSPGRSHHGTPLQVIDMGETALDQETFEEYLTGIREHYAADKYHLLDFNCNSFTNDCIGFLTGGSIPPYITDLPTDFLSTPFGAALRPTIDAMFRGPQNGVSTPPSGINATAPDTRLASSILQDAASRAASSSTSPPPLSETSTLTGQIHVCTNPSSFQHLLKTHRAVIAFFTSAGCPPCRMIEPVFEALANEKGVRQGVAFTKVDMGVGLGHNVASQWNVSVTPTFILFLDGKKTHEMKGADAPELRTQVDLLLYQAYPPHPHTAISFPAVQLLSLKPILFPQVPVFDTVLAKIVAFIDTTTSWPPSSSPSQIEVKEILGKMVVPYLKARFSGNNRTEKASSSLTSASPKLLDSWARSTEILIVALPMSELFPLVDMWRLALLDSAVGTFLSTIPAIDDAKNPLFAFLGKGNTALAGPSPAPRNFILTLLRLLTNAFPCAPLARRVAEEWRASLTPFLVATLLHEDAAVRTASASLAFNVAAWLQKGRVEMLGKGLGVEDSTPEDGEWEVEMVSAVVEAISQEKESEEIVHRLTASLAFLLRLSPSYETHLGPLLEVLQARSILKGKLDEGGCGATGVRKKEARKLIEEVANKLCP